MGKEDLVDLHNAFLEFSAVVLTRLRGQNELLDKLRDKLKKYFRQIHEDIGDMPYSEEIKDLTEWPAFKDFCSIKRAMSMLRALDQAIVLLPNLTTDLPPESMHFFLQLKREVEEI